MSLLFLTLMLRSQNPDTTKVSAIDTSKITFNFKEADVRDVLRAIGVQMGINIVVDKDVEGKITVHLEKIGLEEGLKMMLRANGFSLEKEENYYLVKKMEKERRKDITATRERLTLDIKNIPVDELLREIANQTKINIVADQTVTGEISSVLYDVPLERGLSSLLSANGFMLKKSAGIYEITKASGQPGRRKGLSVTVTSEQIISLNVSDAGIGDILDEISSQADLNVIHYGDIRGTVNAKIDRTPLAEALLLLFQGTNFTYRKVDDIYLVGDKSLTSLKFNTLMSAISLFPVT